MEKPGFSGMKSLDHLRYLTGSLGGSAKAVAVSNPRLSLDSVPHGSFANLKLTAEKLVKEQASVKTDLEMAHAKLKKTTEQIHLLEIKLQEAINENAKLKVKQTEDSKLWKGLDSKLSSTKTLCDQLTETLQHLAGQVRTAEEDKTFFDEKLSKNSKAFDDFDSLLSDLAEKLESAEKTIRNGKQEMMEIRQEKQETEKNLRDGCTARDKVIEEKDTVIEQLNVSWKEDKDHLQTLDSQLQEVQLQLTSTQEICKCLRATQENLEKEKNALQCSNEDFSQKISKSNQEIKKLEDLFHDLTANIVELNEHSSTLPDQISKMLSLSEICYSMVQQEKDLTMKSAQEKFDKLQKQLLLVRFENDSFKVEADELKNKIIELQKAQEYAMVQHADECRLAEDRIRRLESESEVLVSKRNELEKLATDLGENVQNLSEASTLTENKMQDLLQKVSRLESENTDIEAKGQSTLQEKIEEMEVLRTEIAKRDQNVDLLQDQMSQLRNLLDKKEQLHLRFQEREKQLEQQNTEIQASLATAEGKLGEARKQYDLILEGKQLELSKHLKEISQRNDQAINDIRKKYEAEKVEIADSEKEKAERVIKEIERKCNEKMSESKEEAQKFLIHVKEEHATLISRIQQDHDHKETILREQHKEELQRAQLQAENEMREKTASMRKEHEIHIKSLKLQYEDDCRKLEEELELQKSKEEKQRALLQLQWKVMGENQQADQEVNSKKEYSVSSIKMRDPSGGNEKPRDLQRTESGKKDIHLSQLMRTPVANILKKAEKENRESTVGIPKHSKKVTRHEYEFETSNGRTITKRRKTKSTVMFGESNTRRTPRTRTPNASKGTRTPNTSKDVMITRKVTGGPHPNPSNIGDLFSEGSLNPYTDDPYAFD